MYEVRIRKEATVVVLVVNGRRAVELGWQAARALCDALRPHARGEATGETSIKHGRFELAFRTEPPLADELDAKVLCIANGSLLFDAPVAVALAMWAALCSQQRRLEEEAHAEQIAFDGGLLLRTGAPFGLTDNPKLQHEVAKEAGHNRTLRRALPGGVRGAVLSAPRIFHDTRTPAQRLADLFARSNSRVRTGIRALLA